MSNTNPLRTSLRPGTFLLGNIKDRSVKQAFDQVAFDAKTPYQITESEVDKLFAAASADNPYVKGDSTTPTELRDLKMIREKGSWLFRSAAAREAFDTKMAALDSKPEASFTDDDGGIRSKQTAVNKFSIRGKASGFVWCPPNARCIGAPSSISMEVDGKRFSIRPKTGERAISLVRRLAGELEKAGYKAGVSTRYGVSTVEIKQSPSGEGPTIKNNTTDPKVHMEIKGGGVVDVSVGFGAGMSLGGGKIGLHVDGNTFEVKTKEGANPGPALDALRKELIKGGYDVQVTVHQGIDSLEQTWQISAAGSVDKYKPGAWTELEGTIVHHDASNRGPDGGAQAYGSWMVLDDPVMVGDLKVSKIYVGDPNLLQGQAAHLNGRLDVREGPQEIFPAIRFAALTGMSNVGAGEPKFDGKQFTSAKSGKKLDVLSYYPPHITDVPSTIFVIDQGSDKIFKGSSGGFIPQWMNGFHGFRGSAKIENPTTKDHQAVSWPLGSTAPVTQDGTKLTKVGQENGPGLLGKKEWFLNPETSTLYRLVPTTRRGPYRADIDQVARMKTS